MATLERVTVFIHDSDQILNLAVWIMPNPFTMKQYLNAYKACFVYSDHGILRVAVPHRQFFLVPATRFGLHHSKVVTGSRTLELDLDHCTFIGVVDCQEIMQLLFTDGLLIADYKTVATVYLLTVKAASVKSVKRFFDEQIVFKLDTFDSFESLWMTFNTFHAILDSLNTPHPTLVDLALQILD